MIKKNKKDTKNTKQKSSKPSYNSLVRQNHQLKKQNDDLDDKFLRAEAEMQNTHKRAAKDQQQVIKYGGKNIAKGILPSLDNLKRALNIKLLTKGGHQMKQGVKMVYNGLVRTLAQNGVKQIKVDTSHFDPNLEQAVQTMPASHKHPNGSIVKVLQNGYKIHDRILRPAVVVVAKKK